MKALKIIILGPAFPLRGGIAAFNERLARELVRMGHQVHMETFRMQYPAILFPGKTQYSSDAAPEDLSIHVGMNSANPLNWIAVGRRLAKMNADFVICKFWLPFMGPCYGSILRLIRRNKKTEVVSIIDNIIPHEKRPGDRIFARYFCNAVDRFIVMSRSVKDDMDQFIDFQPVKYLPHPIYDNYGAHINRDEALTYLNLEQDYKYILFFGVIRDYKGLDLLLEAMNDERIKDQKIRLIVAGEFYGNENFYRNLIRNLNLGDRIVDHMSFIPNDEVKFFFGAADLVVQPYKSATQSGISQIAYHFEVPMVVTRVGGLPEIVKDGICGYVTDIHTNAIAKAIYDYFDQNKKEEFQVGLREVKKSFSWEIFTHNLLQTSTIPTPL
ncbi:MAG: glycosyltransferase [Bacteroidia bacterium]|nr:glycosyltransferase [Bacteroidia bacterium]